MTEEFPQLRDSAYRESAASHNDRHRHRSRLEISAPQLITHVNQLRRIFKQVISSWPTKVRILGNSWRGWVTAARAALIYLHSSAERQRTLVNAVGDTARAELAKSKKRTTAKSSGTQMA